MRNNRAMFWMSVFVLVFYPLLAALNHRSEQSPKGAELKKEEMFSRQELREKEEAFKRNIKEHPELIGSVTLAFLLILFTGLGLDLYFLGRKLRGLPVWEGPGPPATVGWGVKEVCQLFIFLFFLEALIIFLEMITATFVDMKHWNRDVLLMANSLIRNAGAALLVIVWVKRRFGSPLEAVGLTAKNFWGNVKTGVIGYLAVIPLFFGVLLAMSFVTRLVSYEPEPQTVVQIYLKSSSDKHLLFFTLFVALIGPVIEEIFFRGFTYTAFRKRWGPRWAALGSAAVFALLHLNLIAFIPIFILGVFLATLYEKTGSLVPSMTVHMTHNFLMVNAALIFKGIAS